MIDLKRNSFSNNVLKVFLQTGALFHRTNYFYISFHSKGLVASKLCSFFINHSNFKFYFKTRHQLLQNGATFTLFTKRKKRFYKTGQLSAMITKRDKDNYKTVQLFEKFWMILLSQNGKRVITKWRGFSLQNRERVTLN